MKKKQAKKPRYYWGVEVRAADKWALVRVFRVRAWARVFGAEQLAPARVVKLQVIE